MHDTPAPPVGATVTVPYDRLKEAAMHLLATADLPEIAKDCGEACAWLGVQVDPEANARQGPRLSHPGAAVSAWVIPTNEELMIARHTGRLLGLIEPGN